MSSVSVAAGKTVRRPADPNLLRRVKLPNVLDGCTSGGLMPVVDVGVGGRRANLVHRVLLANVLDGRAVGRLGSEVHVPLRGVKRAKGEQTAGKTVVNVRVEMLHERVVSPSLGV